MTMSRKYQNREPDAWETCPQCKGTGTIQCWQDGQPGLDWCPECDGIQQIPLWKIKDKHSSSASDSALKGQQKSSLDEVTEKMTVEITQFVRPNGEQRVRHAEVPNDCAVGYESLRRHGCRLTAEVLIDGLVSQAIEHPEGDYAIEVTANGPEVTEALHRMLREFDGVEFAKWLKNVRE